MLAEAAPAACTGLDAAELELFRAQGFVILRDVLARETVVRWHDAFLPVLAQQAASEPANRGERRYQTYLPFAAPFDDPRLYAHPRVLAAARAILGDDIALCLLGADTPLPGAGLQEVHRDGALLLPESNPMLPTYIVGVNVPLVDYTEENGPMEIWPGATHLLPSGIEPREELAARLPSVRPLLRAGDVLIRDLRVWHRGTPNRSPAARPNIALTYAMPWFRFGMELPRIARERFSALTPEIQRLLRHCPIVDERSAITLAHAWPDLASAHDGSNG